MSKKTVPARVSGRAGRERPSGSPSKSSPKKAPGFPSDPSRKPKTKAERHALYLEMLVAAQDTPQSGFCGLLYSMGRSWGLSSGLIELPELRAQRPKDADVDWFWWRMGDWRPRIKALKVAIAQTAPATGMRRGSSSPKAKAGAKRSPKQPGSAKRKSPKSK